MSYAGTALRIILAIAVLVAIVFTVLHFRAETDAKAAVRAELIDPGSAEFRNIEIALLTEDGPQRVICGEVNSRNSYGGYVGFQRFVYREKTDEALLESRPAFGQFWRRYCE